MSYDSDVNLTSLGDEATSWPVAWDVVVASPVSHRIWFAEWRMRAFLQDARAVQRRTVGSLVAEAITSKEKNKTQLQTVYMKHDKLV